MSDRPDFIQAKTREQIDEAVTAVLQTAQRRALILAPRLELPVFNTDATYDTLAGLVARDRQAIRYETLSEIDLSGPGSDSASASLATATWSDLSKITGTSGSTFTPLTTCSDRFCGTGSHNSTLAKSILPLVKVTLCSTAYCRTLPNRTIPLSVDGEEAANRRAVLSFTA